MPSSERRYTTAEESAEFFTHLREHAIAPNLEAIARVFDAGKIAVVVFEEAPEAHEALYNFGWNGRDPVFALSRTIAKRLSAGSRADDPVSANWYLTAKAPGVTGKLFIFTGLGTFLMNFTPNGLALEPGSTDREFYS